MVECIFAILSIFPFIIFRGLLEQLLLFFPPEIALFYGTILLLTWWMPIAVFRAWDSRINFKILGAFVLRGILLGPLVYLFVVSSGWFKALPALLVLALGTVKKLKPTTEIFALSQVFFFWGMGLALIVISKNNGHLNLEGLNLGALFDSYVFKDLTYFALGALGGFGLLNLAKFKL